MLTVGVGSYGLACVARFGLIALLSIRRITRHWTVIGLAATTLVWTALGLLTTLGLDGFHPFSEFSDFVRNATLLLLVDQALRGLTDTAETSRPGRLGALLVPLAYALALLLGALSWSDHPAVASWGLIGHVGLAVAGLFLLENLLQASRPHALWSTKHLLIGAGTSFKTNNIAPAKERAA